MDHLLSKEKDVQTRSDTTRVEILI